MAAGAFLGGGTGGGTGQGTLRPAPPQGQGQGLHATIPPRCWFTPSIHCREAKSSMPIRMTLYGLVCLIPLAFADRGRAGKDTSNDKNR